MKIDVSKIEQLLPKKLQNSHLAIYAKVHAYLSPVSGYSLEYGTRSYGHLGGYQRAIVMQKIIEFRPSTKGERKKRREK